MKHLVLILSGILLVSCSTMTFLPTEGPASKFNLATVEYVEAQNANQNESIVQDLSANIDEVLNKALESDRQRIADLEKMLAEQEAKIEALTGAVDSSKATLMMVSGSLRKDLSEIRSSNQDIKLSLDRIKSNVDTLPKEAMVELNNALKAYLGETE